MSNWAHALLRYLRIQRDLLLKGNPIRTRSEGDREAELLRWIVFDEGNIELWDDIEDVIDLWEGRWIARSLKENPFIK
jgi:hypothetical protein